MAKGRFIVLEPSKVGRQHITLLDGYLRSLSQSPTITGQYDIVFRADPRTWEHLSPEARQGVQYEPVKVMDPERRRLLRKTVSECLLILRSYISLAPSDILLVTCTLSTTLYLVERLIGRRRSNNVFFAIHGEIEGLFDPALNHIRSYGFWAKRWAEKRSAQSGIQLVVIDDFIRDTLLATRDNFRADRLHVIPHPVSPTTKDVSVGDSINTVCFIGYRTAFKGFDVFRDLAGRHLHLRFQAIGMGVVEDVRSGEVTPLDGASAFLDAVAGCQIALFPYSGGYSASLSAAVLDAVSTGVHVLATDRPCFVALAAELGPDYVTIYRSSDELSRLLQDEAWISDIERRKKERKRKLSETKYGLASVRKHFEWIALSVRTPASEVK